MKTQKTFQNSSLVSVVNGSIVIKDSTGKEYTFDKASIVSVNNGTIILETKWMPKEGELIKYTWGDTRYCIFREIIANQLWSYGCSTEKLSEFPYDYDTPKFRPYSKNLNISPVTPEEQKEFDDCCKSQGKLWNKETLQWEKYRWLPKKGDSYFYVLTSMSGVRVCHALWGDCTGDYLLYDTHNCFPTEKQAEKAAEKVKELFKLL